MNPPAIPDWNAAADALHTAFPVARWPERLRDWLEVDACADEPWCVALSGGADSVAVLLTLVALRDELRRNVERRMQNAEGGMRNGRCKSAPLRQSRNAEAGRRNEEEQAAGRGAVLQPASARLAFATSVLRPLSTVLAAPTAAPASTP